MNFITALEIQTNGEDVKCSAGGPCKETGKYTGWIELWRGGELHKALISTAPVFDTSEAAVEKMEEIVRAVRKMDLRSKDITHA